MTGKESQGESEQPKPDLSRLYYDSEVIHEETIFGITFKIKEIPGDEYTGLVDRCTDMAKGELQRRKYFFDLIKTCVVEPKDINIKMLKPGALTALAARIEDILGLTEVMQKNLMRK